jgi:hypothetical protein
MILGAITGNIDVRAGRSLPETPITSPPIRLNNYMLADMFGDDFVEQSVQKRSAAKIGWQRSALLYPATWPYSNADIKNRIRTRDLNQTANPVAKACDQISHGSFES